MHRLLIILVPLWLLGCQAAPQHKSYARYSNPATQLDLVKLSQKAAKELAEKSRHHLQLTEPLLTTSFANIDKLDRSSTFGRMMGDQVASGFVNQGYTMIEMKLRNSVFIKSGSGEFMLSRDVRDVSRSHNAQAVIVGTYAEAHSHVYITARLIDAQKNVVLATVDYRVPKDRDMRKLLSQYKENGYYSLYSPGY